MTTITLHQPRVLIVDDDLMMRVLVRKSLEESKMTVVEAADGTKGVEIFQQQRPDVVLLDVMMPGIDGFEACRKIRELPGGEHTPILLLTGLDDAESIQRAYDSGATDFITKPIVWPLLGHRVRYVLRASSAVLDLAKSQASLANAQRIAALGSWDWNLLDGKIIWSDEIYRICGFTAGQTMSDLSAFLNTVHSEDREQLKQSIADAVKDCTSFGIDHRIVLSDGSERIVHAHGEPTIDETGKVVRLAGTLQDITERRRAEEQIRYLAFFDSLTGLPNRQWFKEVFNHAEVRAKRSGAKMAILCLGLDRFKLVNDTLGHNVGDRLLQEVTKRLRGCLRNSDPVAMRDGNDVARLGGDEFTVLLNDVHNVQDINKLAHRILDAMIPIFNFDDYEITVTASVGVAVYPDDGIEFDDLLKNADSAMDHAKRQGRSEVQFYTESINTTALEKLQLENRLRKAVERNEFELHYQPKVDLKNGNISGVEALIRWRDPEVGMISPARFIPVAEETGLIMPIGEWVLKTACAQIKAWHQAGYTGLTMAVNISARQFRQQNIPQLVRQTLGETELDPSCLELELTESVLMHDHQAVVEILRELKKIGVLLSLDDFGTGYSSLSYLRRFPIDIVKVDQAFVRDLTNSPGDASLAKAIIAMAHSLNMKTIAEGVETQGQLAFLSEHQCDAIQGYYFSRPVPAKDLLTLLVEGKRIPDADLYRERLKHAVLLMDNEESTISALKLSLVREGYRLKSLAAVENNLAQLGFVAIGKLVADSDKD
ncbi:MAG: EAL domain-containing protein [Pseudomonadota bacterium]